ncbi:ABC transporter substrate-binding protein [uncultured Paraglaciecola sp.]|uniref:substrate-binding periplasmic protein n=1 Tax=uncultured Paraglaciecola sp. TaxID=1765024 RepID=UPI0026257887|nr:transporter substrate-binding domain-containing protein [uncultured Paraglaciecola sp.]
MRLFTILFFCVICTFFANSASKPIIGSYYIPGLVIDKSHGLFIQLHKLIMERVAVESELVLQSTKSMQNSFKDNQVLAYFPELWENVPKKNAVISDTIWLKKIIVYTLNNRQVNSIKDLEGLNIGAVSGYSYGETITNNPKISIDYADNDDINVERLIKRRIDAIIGDQISTQFAVNNSQFKDRIRYDVDKPLEVLNVFYVCQKTLDGIALCEHISSAIANLRENGILMLNASSGETQLNLQLAR